MHTRAQAQVTRLTSSLQEAEGEIHAADRDFVGGEEALKIAQEFLNHAKVEQKEAEKAMEMAKKEVSDNQLEDTICLRCYLIQLCKGCRSGQDVIDGLLTRGQKKLLEIAHEGVSFFGYPNAVVMPRCSTRLYDHCHYGKDLIDRVTSWLKRRHISSI